MRPRGGDFLPLDQFLAQAVGRLLQRQAPVIQHEQIVGGANRARDMVEVRVLIGMQADHLAERQQQAERENRDARQAASCGDVLFSQFISHAKATPASTVIGGITKMKWRMPL